MAATPTPKPMPPGAKRRGHHPSWYVRGKPDPPPDWTQEKEDEHLRATGRSFAAKDPSFAADTAPEPRAGALDTRGPTGPAAATRSIFDDDPTHDEEPTLRSQDEPMRRPVPYQRPEPPAREPIDDIIVPVFLAGYQGRNPESFHRATQGHLVVDVRLKPTSPIPGWKKEELEALFGESYIHVPQWGNDLRFEQIGRPRGQDSPPDPDAFELTAPDAPRPVRILAFEEGLRAVRVRLLAEERPIVLLCACRETSSCHRRVLATMLQRRGWAKASEF